MTSLSFMELHGNSANIMLVSFKVFIHLFVFLWVTKKINLAFD